MGFNKDFIWGAATSSYQIEGAAYSDGKGLNIWDTFCKEEGKIFGGQNGDIACDHYNRMEEDVELMAKMGLKAYRFSISWSRLLPNGTGEICQAGIDFYNRLINKLLEYKIEPYITLYHWDLPYALHQQGGWLNPEIATWFGDYAKLVAQCYSDRVRYFMTINEPQVILGNGYVGGDHAPGHRLGKKESLQIGHNILTAHGTAVKALREYAKQPVQIGIVMATCPAIPASESPEDVKAAKEAYAAASRDNFIGTDVYWLDPIVLGKYPEGLLASAQDIMPNYSKENMQLINQPIDFVGANIYWGNTFKAGEKGQPIAVKLPDGTPRTAIGWSITPSALYWGAVENCGRYHLPYYITENGMSAHDAVSLDGQVHDPNRIDYMNRYLLGLEQAAKEGHPITGYFAWSLMDNFEWANGYNDRFGLIYVDFQTGQRLLKDSAHWYKKVIESNGESLHQY